MSEFQNYTTKISNIGGEVFVSLPNDVYMMLTPEQARQLGGRLFINAAEALGQERPEIVVLK